VARGHRWFDVGPDHACEFHVVIDRDGRQADRAGRADALRAWFFRASGDGGALLPAFVRRLDYEHADNRNEHRERKGYSSQVRFGYFGRTLADIVETFAPIRDARILTVRPQRIDIVQASRSETLQEIARRFDASVPPEQLAVLNHLPASSTRVERGSLVKLVI
jgi:hypothetical protein